MKILFVLENHYPNIGGVETLFKNLTESLVKEGHQITVLTNQFSPRLEKREKLNGVSIIRVPFRNRYVFTILGIFPSWRQALKHDIIHTTSYNAGVPAFFAGVLARKKVIITFHEVWSKLWFDLPYMNKVFLWLHYIFEKFLLKLPFYRFVAVSTYTKNSLIKAGVPEQKISLIHNGIRYEEIISLKKEVKRESTLEVNKDFTFIYFGRLGISKGLDIILEGIKKLKGSKSKKFKFRLIIPSLPADFHRTILDGLTSYDIEDVVEVESDLPWKVLVKRIIESDAVVIPSYSEGFCFTAVESMAIGTPIISSGNGALKEVISGKHITMATHDSEGLYKAMSQALEDNWDEISLKKFPLSISIEKYMSMYNDIFNYKSTS